MPHKLHLPAILVIAGILTYLSSSFFLRNEPKRPPATSHSESGQQPPSSSKTPAKTPSSTPPAIDPTNTDPRFTRFTDGTIHLLPSFTTSHQLHQSDDPRADLELISQLLADYRLVFKENPVGTENAEIVAQLLGDNPKKTWFIDPTLAALTNTGELLDRWGSPYIFHPLKADLMDVRSIGPDQKPWTGDDLSLDLKAVEDELLLHPTQ